MTSLNAAADGATQALRRYGGKSVDLVKPGRPPDAATFSAIPPEETWRSLSPWLLTLLALHVPLGFLVRTQPLAATAHAYLVLGVGVMWLAQRRFDRVAAVAGYIAGAELLWRAGHAAIFWEFGKFATVLLLGLAVLSNRKRLAHSGIYILYFALLVPSIAVLPAFNYQHISFNLAGPLALAVSAVFFSGVHLTRAQLQRIMFAIMLPVVSLAAVASDAVSRVDAAEFGPTGATLAVTGDIGPNQVSSILGLGMLAAGGLALSTKVRRAWPVRLFYVAILLWFLGQALLTFSRGGVLSAVGAMVAGGVYLFREERQKMVFFVSSVAVAALLGYGILPALERITGGTLQSRFTTMHSTGRYEIALADLQAFQENPVLGVGPHQSKAYHARTFRYSSSHTEYSRMLAEHGSLGLAALLLLAWMAQHRLRRKLPFDLKAYSTALTVWGLLFMVHAATRLVAPSFAFGLAGALFVGTARTPAARAVLARPRGGGLTPPTGLRRQPTSGDAR